MTSYLPLPGSERISAVQIFSSTMLASSMKFNSTVQNTILMWETFLRVHSIWHTSYHNKPTICWRTNANQIIRKHFQLHFMYSYYQHYYDISFYIQYFRFSQQWSFKLTSTVLPNPEDLNLKFLRPVQAYNINSFFRPTRMIWQLDHKRMVKE